MSYFLFNYLIPNCDSQLPTFKSKKIIKKRLFQRTHNRDSDTIDKRQQFNYLII